MAQRAGLKFLLPLLALAALPQASRAQATGPYIDEKTFDSYDLESLKGGEWVEYRWTAETVTDKGVSKPGMEYSYRIACVLVEPETVWFESSEFTARQPDLKGTLVLAAVGRKSGLVTRAWWGKPGETGKELKVQKAGVATPWSGVTGTAKVTRETIKAGGAEYECEKIESELTTTFNGTVAKAKHTLWNSETVPFKGKAPSEVAKESMKSLTWEGTPTWKGWKVKETIERKIGEDISKATKELLGCGTDAKPTIEK